MTKKLYLNDSYLTQCQAVVLNCTPAGEGFDVELDQTVLFPTGGGQPYDTGWIGEAAVTDVTEAGERVLHHTNQPLEVGSQVTVTVDWPRRFDHMQQHSGEHILSFAAWELFGAHNVGFHMAQTYCTIDLDQPLSPEQVARLEKRTNALVAQNLPVQIQYVTPEQLAGMELRKKAAGLKGEIRIVFMPGGDSCTCCATHVKALGEVGQVKVASVEHYKGGARLVFHCGMRALGHAQRMQDIVEGVARRFSTKPEDVGEAVLRMQQEQNQLRRENKELYQKLNGYLAQEILGSAPEGKGVKLCVRMLEGLPAAQLKPLAQALCKAQKALALLCAPNGEMVQYLLCASDGVGLDMGELCQAVNAALGGRGGGKGTLAQGSAKTAPGQIEALEQLATYLMQRIKAR